jgi:hypothetical protein
MLLPETAAQYAAEAEQLAELYPSRALVFALLSIAAQLNPAVSYEDEDDEAFQRLRGLFDEWRRLEAQ